MAAPNVLPQLKAGTLLEVFAYDRANVKMLATGRVAAMTARSIPVPVGNSILLATDIESGDAPALCERFVV